MTTLSASKHRERAARHELVGDALVEAASNEWAAVCYFYAAYHLVKAALVDDVIFDDWSTCQAKSPDLLPQDRYTSIHKGRRKTSAGREWGLNELVQLLYPSVIGLYDRLHQASCDVRYGDGLRTSTVTIQGIYQEFKSLVERGALVSS